MQTVVVGEKFDKCDFRETCFGICVNNGKALLVKEPDNYSLIGGGIEKGEDLASCLKREFIEESGYTIINTKEFVCIDCYWITRYKDKMNSKANIFIVEVDLSNVAQPIEKKCKPVWVELGEVCDLLVLPYQKAAFEMYLENWGKNK